ncbi:MAG TPA: DUF4007 family protein, partial [Blastocatellia bacterium]|nr:DUF4007 family protein [Blastocatellia bacterium]
MQRRPLGSTDFKGQFSGHETFPLRYGWLNKVFDAVVESKDRSNTSLFTDEDAIARFGVGKNMVASMKHWSLATGVMEAREGGFRISRFGNLLMGERGWDRYLETQAALWLLHWKLVSSSSRATTWHWAFNYYSGVLFDLDTLVDDLSQFCRERNLSRVAPTTIRRDVECFIKTYAPTTRFASNAATEDTLECPLAELALIRSSGLRGGYQFQKGPKPSLSDPVFAYALDEFWKRHTSAKTLTVEAITYEAGSPGRIFK